MLGNLIEKEWREKLPPICPECEYNLTGILSDRCPECGQVFLRSELRRNAKDVYHSLRQMENVNDILNVGVYLGIAGAAFILFFWLINWASGPSRIVGFFLGIATFGSGVQVFRIKRFPKWVKEFLTAKPNYLKGAAIALFGLGVIALAVFLP